MPLVTIEEVQRVARLARLTLTAHEAEAMTEHVTKILTYVDTLNAVPTDTVEPITHAVSGPMPLRTDAVTNVPDPTLLRTAPATEATFFQVPKIIE